MIAAVDRHRFEELVHQSGFMAKPIWYARTEEAFGSEFLRHLWMPTAEGTGHWYPSPASVIKMTKVLRDPLLLGGYGHVMNMMGQCLKFVPSSYPVVGACKEFLQNAKSVKQGKAISLEHLVPDREYKAQASRNIPEPNVATVWAVLREKYGDISILDEVLRDFSATGLIRQNVWPMKVTGKERSAAVQHAIKSIMHVDYA
jgi:hypothetical protein